MGYFIGRCVEIIAILFIGVLTSFYYFPIEFTFLPGVNTKMTLAGLGLVVLFVQLARQRKPHINSGVLKLSLMALAVSFWGVISVAYNETYDYTYATYFLSMWVWMSGAYFVITLMKDLHRCISVELVCNYFISICVAQCMSALMMNYIPELKSLIDSYVSGFGYVDTSVMTKGERLYGIGAGLDVAGLKFSAALVSIAYLVVNHVKNGRNRFVWPYLISFMFIVIIGNMIARTTTVGVILAFVYWLFVSFKEQGPIISQWYISLWKNIILIALFVVIICVLFYNVSTDFKDNMEFAFEGFFSLWNEGVWLVTSNENLKNMYIFPDNFKTWIIGDGYIENPRVTDPYYTGKVYRGYYMGTDVGYLRFLFYFGILGLGSFIFYFIGVTKCCMKKFPLQGVLFLLFLGVNFMGWFKVSTDIFMMFAPFLFINKEDNEERERLTVCG